MTAEADNSSGIRDIKKASFGHVARIYDEVRPGYPPELISGIYAVAGLTPQAHLLEVGCGSGQATFAFARCGCRITALDLSPKLLDLALAKTSAGDNLEFVCFNFEEWNPPHCNFDLLYSATAFHWIDEKRGLSKAAALLKNGGLIALFWNTEPLEKQDPGFTSFIDETIECIEPGFSGSNMHIPLITRIQAYQEALRAHGAFEGYSRKVYQWNKTYSAAQCAGLFLTHSRYAHWNSEQRRELSSRIERWILERGGSVLREYETILLLARKLS